MLARTVPPLPVLAYDEIVLGTDVQPVAAVSARDTNETINQTTQELVAAT